MHVNLVPHIIMLSCVRVWFVLGNKGSTWCSVDQNHQEWLNSTRLELAVCAHEEQIKCALALQNP